MNINSCNEQKLHIFVNDVTDSELLFSPLTSSLNMQWCFHVLSCFILRKKWNEGRQKNIFVRFLFENATCRFKNFCILSLPCFYALYHRVFLYICFSIIMQKLQETIACTYCTWGLQSIVYRANQQKRLSKKDKVKEDEEEYP